MVHIVVMTVKLHTQRLEVLHSKLQNLSEKHENIKSTYWAYLEEKKLNSRKKGLRYCIISFYSKDIPKFNELVIKNTHVKIKNIVFAFVEGFHLPHGQISL